jgi:hypothetical protein
MHRNNQTTITVDSVIKPNQMAIQIPVVARSNRFTAVNATLPTTATSMTTRRSGKAILYHLLTVHFEVSRIQAFFQGIIPRYCPNDMDLIHVAQTTYDAIRIKILEQNSGPRRSMTKTNPRITLSHQCNDELNDCITILSRFLSSCSATAITPQTLLEAHYLIGCIHETLHHTYEANQSYIKALWILSVNSTSNTIPIEMLATTLHCLGRTYGLLEQHQEAYHVLCQAKYQYRVLNVHKDHTVFRTLCQLLDCQERKRINMVQAAERLSFKNNKNNESATSTTLSISQRTALTLIVEEEEIEETI